MTESDKNPQQGIEIDHLTDNLETISIMSSSEKKRVCVIGAGASGLVSMKVIELIIF